MQRHLIDQTPQASIYFANSRNPTATNFGVRATLKSEPASIFDARFKFNYGRVHGHGPQAAGAFVSCPLGARQFSSPDPVIGNIAQCCAGKFNVNAGYGPVLATSHRAWVCSAATQKFPGSGPVSVEAGHELSSF